MSERSEQSYDEIRRRVEKRYKERQALIIHLAVFVVANIAIWAFWLLISSGGSDALAAIDMVDDAEYFAFPWPLIVTLGWSIGIVSHYLTYYFKHGSGANRREDAIQREVEQEMARIGDFNGYEKPKNESRMRLTEDGELEEVSDTDIRYAAKSKR